MAGERYENGTRVEAAADLHSPLQTCRRFFWDASDALYSVVMPCCDVCRGAREGQATRNILGACLKELANPI